MTLHINDFPSLHSRLPDLILFADIIVYPIKLAASNIRVTLRILGHLCL